MSAIKIAETIDEIERMMLLLGTMKANLMSCLPEEDEVAKPKKEDTEHSDSEKEKEKDKEKRKPSEWNKMSSEVTTMVKTILAGKDMPKGLHLKVAGYLKEQGKTTGSFNIKDVEHAMKYMEENPDHKSKTQKARSKTSSTDGESKEKKIRGRLKKAKKEINPFDEI
jgi:hypothetical protein